MPKLKKAKIEVVYLKDRTAPALKAYTRKYGACLEARRLAEGRSLKEVWGKIAYMSWLRWYLFRQPIHAETYLQYAQAMEAVNAASKVYSKTHKGKAYTYRGMCMAECKAFRKYYKVR